MTAFCPNKAEKVLELEYGRDWRKPKVRACAAGERA